MSSILESIEELNKKVGAKIGNANIQEAITEYAKASEINLGNAITIDEMVNKIAESKEQVTPEEPVVPEG